jgi:hypothetical protein
MQHEAFGYADV